MPSARRRCPTAPAGVAVVPQVTGPIKRRGPVETRDMRFLRSNTTHLAKITLPGPFTMAQQAKNVHYADEEEMAMAYAAAVNEEAHDLLAAGADIIQFDEPWLQARLTPPSATACARSTVRWRGCRPHHRAPVLRLRGDGGHKPSGYSFLPQLADTTAGAISIEAAQPNLDLGVLRELSGKTILLGVIDLGSKEVETAETIAGRIRAGLRHLPAEKLVAAPDCGMKYLPRERAFGKLKALAEGAAIVRHELAGS